MPAWFNQPASITTLSLCSQSAPSKKTPHSPWGGKYIVEVEAVVVAVADVVVVVVAVMVVAVVVGVAVIVVVLVVEQS